MRGVLALVAATGCNQIFDLRSTQPAATIDAQYFDAPIDAPFGCPAVGEPPPVYSRVLRQIPQNCKDYTLSASAGIATATCFEPSSHVAEGPLFASLAPIAGMDSSPGGTQFQTPRLAPEGTALFYLKRTSSTAVIERRDRNTDDTWAAAVALTPGNLGQAVQLGTPTRGPLRRMMMSRGNGAIEEIELGASNTWTSIASYTDTELGAVFINGAPSLSPDGLRIVWNAQDLDTSAENTYYATRPSLSARFTEPTRLQGVPGATSPFMTEDCAHVYFYAAASILYVQQQ